MQPANVILFIYLLSSYSESTDLIISYKGDLKIIENVDSTENASMPVRNLHLAKKFGFPMALFYTENGHKLFLSDYDNEAIDIYSISLGDYNKINPVIKSIGTSQIESITFDPLLEKLYWSDVFKYGIYTNSSSSNSQPNILYETGSMQPRSISLDACKQLLYWSDRDEMSPKITAFNLITKLPEIIQKSSSNTFYHAITFDSYDNQLWWFETNGDASSQTSCKIMKKTDTEISLYATLDHCYPFAMTLDKKFLYWNDWGKGAVLRLSKTNPLDLVELLSVPSEGKYRAYGIANLNHTYNFNCDVSFVIDNDISRIDSLEHFNRLTNQEVQVGNGAGQLNARNDIGSWAFTLFPDQSTSVTEMKKMYNNLHEIQLVILLLLLLFSTIVVFGLMKLYRFNLKIEKKLLKSSTIDIDALPPFEVSKPVKKFKRFVPRISASPRTENALDIENCCQLTLCDKPCEIAMNKAARFSVKLKKSEDKLRLLDDSMA